MSAYYNEIEPYPAQWLRNLIKAGHIADGIVDTRSIEDVQPEDLDGFAQCHFFAGLAGWSLAARLAGWPDDRSLWTGSPPCQPFSVAGKGFGHDDERHLWPHYFRLIRSRRPAVVMGENVTGAVGKNWLDGVFSDLEGIDYAGRAVVLPACAVNAKHRRDRIAFIAHPIGNEQSRQEPRLGSPRRMGGLIEPISWDGGWEDSLRSLRAVDDGIQRCVEATDAARNAITPPLFAEVIAAYMETHP